MRRYVVRRVLQFIPVLLGVTLVLFALTRIVPGDPARFLSGSHASNPAVVRAVRQAYGLDKPIVQQYVDYLGALAHGDLGTSIETGRDVSAIIAEKYPFTLRLALVALAIEVLLGLGAGALSAGRHRPLLDSLITVSTSVIIAVPAFWLGIVLQVAFGTWLKEVTGGAVSLPVSGAGPGPYPSWSYLILPSVTLAAVSTAYAARIVRGQLLEIQDADFIRAARSRGLSDGAVFMRHSLRNALIPFVTFVALDFGILMSGAILTETVFNWPGIGYTIYTSIGNRDWPVVIGATLLVTLVTMSISLAVDVSYALIDPRIRYGEGRG